MDSNAGIYEAIPHRPPFLWVDAIISCEPGSIVTEKYVDPNLELFKGHYPGHPIMPGVLLCEAVFQTGALLMARTLQKSGSKKGNDRQIPVLTRITAAKFKREVRPGDTIRMQVQLVENLGAAWFFKGKVLVDDRTAVKVEFACALTGGD